MLAALIFAPASAAAADNLAGQASVIDGDTLEIHEDAIKPGQSVLISDDLLATGGTAAATVELIRKLGGKVVGASFAVELTFLNGRAKLPGIDVFTMIQYDK